MPPPRSGNTQPPSRNNNNGKKRARRHASSGPGPAPTSLVQLLREDPQVLDYFQALQASLERDVQIQKDRAQAALAEQKRLQAELDQWKKKKKRKNGSTQPNRNKPSDKKSAADPNEHSEDEDEKPAQDEPRPRNNHENATKEAGSQRPDSLQHANDGDHNNDATNGAGASEKLDLAKRQTESLPMEDSLFDLSDDEEDMSSLSEAEEMETTTKSTPIPDFGEEQRQEEKEMVKEDRKEIFTFLNEAHEILTCLGISTVVREEKAYEDTAIQEKKDVTSAAADDDFGFDVGSDGKDVVGKHIKPTMPEIVGRKSDEILATEILDSIRNNTLIPSCLIGDSTDRVSSNTLILVHPEALILGCNPSNRDDSGKTNSLQESLQAGKRLLLRVLVLLDTFCSPLVTANEWDSYFEDEHNVNLSAGEAATASDKLKAMRVGLRGRKAVIGRLLVFLDGAVSERWAWYDRSIRLATHYCHYVPSERDDEIASVSLKSDGSSNCSWLWTLPGRSMMAQYTSFLHLLQADHEKAARIVVEYVLSTSPSMSIEEHPKLPPVMSFATLESLLLLPDVEMYEKYLDDNFSPEDCTGERGHCKSCWFSAHILQNHRDDGVGTEDLLLKAISLAVHYAASIWNERLASWDEKIHDVASVELAAYQRLLEAVDWLNMGHKEDENSVRVASVAMIDLQVKIRSFVNHLLSINDLSDNGIVPSQCPVRHYDDTLQIALTLQGEAAPVESVVVEALRQIDDESWNDAQNEKLRHALVNLCRIERNLKLREFDTYGRQTGVFTKMTAPLMDLNELFDRLCTRASGVANKNLWPLLCTFLQCSGIVADGHTALRVMQTLLCVEGDFESESELTCESIRRASVVPLVRVINLRRRGDRMKAFMSQAAREGLLIVQAVASFDTSACCSKNYGSPFDEFVEFGGFAIDGKGRLAEATKHLVDLMGSAERLDQVVASHWRPSDLKAFDKDAPDGEHLVRASPTERACALSHVASWHGALRSLTISTGSTDTLSASKLFSHPQHILRTFKISGFAEGQALLPQNDNMPPAPVCVILEDDAVLVDHFAEKLADLLKELPRDFHFCSLGYSRPKSAPIVPCGTKIGIPSMLWYLTGYCISEAGARYLLDRLPVTGPVDSWIGLQMTRNWDNIYGSRIGLGAHARGPTTDHPAVTLRDLRTILQFRAFCARSPLCTQKMLVTTTATVASAGTVVAASTARAWRQRDTDIEYSGGVMATTAARPS